MAMTSTVFDELLAQELSGVSFVQDYVQLQFNPSPLLNVLTPITVRSGEEFARLGDPNFANMLIGRINSYVDTVEFREANWLKIIFRDGAEISLSLKESDYSGPEALNLVRRDGSIVVI